MKLFKKFIGLTLIVTLVAVFAGCGGGNADAKYEGKYTAVCGEVMGMTMTDADMDDFDLDLKSGGKADVVISGESYSVSWTNDDKNITLKVDGVDLVGEIGEDTIKFTDMLGMGMDVTFAKEGTDAANPENYLPEEEKALIGKWVSKDVTDVLGDPVEGVAKDALMVEFKADHTATLKYGDVDHGTATWGLYSGFGSFENFSGLADGDSITFEPTDGDIKVTYCVGDVYYNFLCEK